MCDYADARVHNAQRQQFGAGRDRGDDDQQNTGLAAKSLIEQHLQAFAFMLQNCNAKQFYF